VRVEEMPRFKGSGPERFIKWVHGQVAYPEEAAINGIEGTVIVSFIINEEGKVDQCRILRSAHPALDVEVLRILSMAPGWEPGRQRGKKVKVAFTIPVKFILQ
jgi:protein TonB